LDAKVFPVSKFAKKPLLFSEKDIDRYAFKGEVFPETVLKKPLVWFFDVLR
jgi:hypothetical protein